MKLMAKLLSAACAGTALLFAVYYFNLDMKLIRSVVVPLLDRHYDSVTREHVI